jgi:hypothetical protein
LGWLDIASSGHHCHFVTDMPGFGHRRSALLAAAAVLALWAGCGGDDGADAPAVLRSVDQVDRAVERVEARAGDSVGPAARRARATRHLLDKWYGQHVAVFAADDQTAGGRVRALLDGLAAISPSLVTRDAAGNPAGFDDEGIARALTPDGATRALARRERKTIEREVGELSEALGDLPASTVIDGAAGGAAVDDLLIDLQERLRLLYPDLADRVLALRVDLPR